MPRRRPPTGPREDEPAVVDVDAANRAYLDDELPPKETRGEKKRKALQLERLGESLVKLDPSKFARVPLPDDLRAAVEEARRLLPKSSAHGGYRRQVQFIGKIMRNVDAQPIADAIESMKQEDAPSAATFKAAERWRDRLIAGTDDDLAALLVEHPSVDRTRTRQLVRQAQKEAKEKKPPHAARALFRELRELFLGS